MEQELASGIGKSVKREGRTTPSSNFDEEEAGQVMNRVSKCQLKANAKLL